MTVRWLRVITTLVVVTISASAEVLVVEPPAEDLPAITVEIGIKGRRLTDWSTQPVTFRIDSRVPFDGYVGVGEPVGSEYAHDFSRADRVTVSQGGSWSKTILAKEPYYFRPGAPLDVYWLDRDANVRGKVRVPTADEGTARFVVVTDEPLGEGLPDDSPVLVVSRSDFVRYAEEGVPPTDAYGIELATWTELPEATRQGLAMGRIVFFGDADREAFDSGPLLRRLLPVDGLEVDATDLTPSAVSREVLTSAGHRFVVGANTFAPFYPGSYPELLEIFVEPPSGLELPKALSRDAIASRIVNRNVAMDAATRQAMFNNGGALAAGAAALIGLGFLLGAARRAVRVAAWISIVICGTLVLTIDEPRGSHLVLRHVDVEQGITRTYTVKESITFDANTMTEPPYFEREDAMLEEFYRLERRNLGSLVEAKHSRTRPFAGQPLVWLHTSSRLDPRNENTLVLDVTRFGHDLRVTFPFETRGVVNARWECDDHSHDAIVRLDGDDEVLLDADELRATSRSQLFGWVLIGTVEREMAFHERAAYAVGLDDEMDHDRSITVWTGALGDAGVPRTWSYGSLIVARAPREAVLLPVAGSTRKTPRRVSLRAWVFSRSGFAADPEPVSLVLSGSRGTIELSATWSNSEERATKKWSRRWQGDVGLFEATLTADELAGIGGHDELLRVRTERELPAGDEIEIDMNVEG